MQGLERVPVVVWDRKWVNKTWRIHLKLTQESVVIPILLTGLIERQLHVIIEDKDERLEINPCFIANIYPKGKAWFVALETCYEYQNPVTGVKVTAMYRENATLTILESLKASAPQEKSAPKEPPPPKKETSPEKKTALLGLHRLFDLPRFQAFMAQKCDKIISDKAVCKNEFKVSTGVESCADLSEETINAWRQEFNAWLKGGGN